MSYTPINWQTGQTITADKLNKMDNGWGVESTQLFSETVTTVAGEYGNEGRITYSSQVSSPAITVTFDGTDYQCSVVQLPEDSGYGYGGVTSGWEYDFTTYPFAFVSANGDGNILATDAAGSHAIAVVGDTIVTSSDFSVAVGKCLPILKVELGKTTFQEASDAIHEGLFVFGWDDDNGRMFYAVNTVEDAGTPAYRLLALTRASGGTTPTTVEYSASSPTDPLYAN